MTKDLYALYQPDIEAAQRGIPFHTSRGITVWLVPDWAEEWDRNTLDRARRMKDYLDLDLWEVPEGVRQQVILGDFETAVVAWDATTGTGDPLPCTAAEKRRVATEVRPFLLEVLAEVRRRRDARQEAVLLLGKGFSASSEPSSSIPEAPTDAPSSAL